MPALGKKGKTGIRATQVFIETFETGKINYVPKKKRGIFRLNKHLAIQCCISTTNVP